MPSEQRKSLIAHAPAGLFAQQGFHATSLREIALAAGVSEALLLKYFPTNKDLLRVSLEYRFPMEKIKTDCR